MKHTTCSFKYTCVLDMTHFAKELPVNDLFPLLSKHHGHNARCLLNKYMQQTPDGVCAQC